jgi:prolyl 4-hydroxylase
MKSRLQPLLVALLLLFFAFPSSDAAAADESNSVCTANDAGAECSAATISEEDDDDTPSSCVDEHEECQNWSEHGECDKNPGYMLFNCKRSCKVCPIIDDNDFGKPQEIPQGENFDKVREVIIKSTEYMRRIRKDEVYHEVRQMCLNQHAGCSQWAVGSGCEDNPYFMKKQCAPACQSCDFILHVYNECKFDPNKADNAIESGGMDLLFETIIVRADDFGFEPTIWSRPKKMPNAHGYLKPCEKDIYNPCGVPDGPWVLTLENFVSSKEVDILKEWGAKFGYERSLAGDQVNDVRTSSQTVRMFHAFISITHLVTVILSNFNSYCLYYVITLPFWTLSGVLETAMPTLSWLHSERRSINSQIFPNKTQNTYSC